MAKTKISEFSATPANNTDIDSINIAEGCSPSGINDAIRELMAQLKDFQTGAVGDSFNGPVGTTTAAAGAFTTLSASSTVSGTGFSTYLASPPAIGGTAAAAGSFTTLSASGNVTLSGGTANGVAYLNGSKVVTSGSALTFDGANLQVGSNAAYYGTLNAARNTTTPYATITATDQANAANEVGIYLRANGTNPVGFSSAGAPIAFYLGGPGVSEQMRLTSTGLGIGTSSPAYKLQVDGASTSGFVTPIVAKNPSTNAASGSKIAFDGGGTVWGEVGAAYNSNDPYMAFFVRAGSEKMRITDAGNLGLGVTPSAFTFGKALQINGAAFSGDATTWRTRVTTNAYNDGNWRYLQNNYAQMYVQNSSSGDHSWHIAASGTAGNAITFTQAMTLDASGQLQLGTTSQTSDGQLSITTTGSNNSLITTNWADNKFLQKMYYSSAYYLGVRADAANREIALMANSDDATARIAFYTGNNGTVVERSRIDASGTLLVNTTSSGTGIDTTATKLFVVAPNSSFGAAFTAVADSQGRTIRITDQSRTVIGALDAGSSSVNLGTNSAHPLIFLTNGSERARIDSSGNFCVGTTAKVYDGKISVGFSSTGSQGIALIDNTATTGGIYAYFINSAGNIAGSISHATTTTVLFNTTSDYRLKNVIGAVSGSGERIDALEPIEYEWKEDGKRTRGFLAHKFQEVYADSVSGEKDAVDADGKAVYQQMQAGTSEVIADLVAEIQSLRQRVATLEAK